MNLLQQPVEQLLEELKPSPSCLISDKHFAWTAEMALKFHVPIVSFDGTNCFSRLCFNSLHVFKVYENVLSDTDTFVVPGLPDRIELRKAQLPGAFNPGPNGKDMNVFREKVREAEAEAYGVLVNSYEELEPAYVEEYRKATGQRVWCVGPVSLCSQEDMDKVDRGNVKFNFRIVGLEASFIRIPPIATI
jgi:UDP-glucosyl transferase 73C